MTRQTIIGFVFVAIAIGFVAAEMILHQLNNFGVGAAFIVLTLGAIIIEPAVVTGWFAQLISIVTAWRQGRRDQQP